MHQHLTTTALLASEATDRGIALGVTITLLVVAAAVALLWIAAVVSIVRSPRYAAAGKTLWILVIIAVPILGALGWFIWGRHAQLTVLDGLTVDRPAQR
ncbi:PLDc_N domain-containing protein [Rhodococcus fascians]|nr:PLDc_N domain-containing protein [Rhodococcus fascians]MBY4397017.1 PLDc_N domain-containing protein [Rhodococcus fascians]MBY4405837.1 PLDc_N domain-containing protein [Rhodococcus fascians]MBY4421775.1 PLDc_N domain-containing protein [Rhodococcus fascians]MBY4460955.1 PLDc_N domain-containing protein [Rhodococcus fascians]